MVMFFDDIKEMKTTHKVELIISYILRATIAAAFVGALIKRQWFTVFLAAIILLLTFLPAIIKRNYKVYLPMEFELFIIIFIYAALYLGEIHAYYTKFWWWDIVLHTSSGLLLGFIGFLIVYILNYEKRVHLNMSPGFVGLFSFTFALAIGALWEIFEFALDSTFGSNMQMTGIVDTIGDLIVDSLAALTVAIIGYSYTKSGHSFILSNLIAKFVDANPRMFK